MIHQLAPFRFLALLAHAVAATLLFRGVPALVASGLALGVDEGAILKREGLLVAFIFLTLGSLFGEAMLLAFGTSLGLPKLCLASGVLHCLGALFTTWALFDGWHWQSVPVLFALFAFPPLVWELALARPATPVVIACARACGCCVVCVTSRLGPCCSAAAKRLAEGLVACWGWSAKNVAPQLRSLCSRLSQCIFGLHSYSSPGFNRDRRGSDAGAELT